MLGLMRLEVLPLPADPILLVHLTLVAVLMMVFPFSKLLHAPGLFFSPTRNQVDDPREAPPPGGVGGADRQTETPGRRTPRPSFKAPPPCKFQAPQAPALKPFR